MPTRSFKVIIADRRFLVREGLREVLRRVCDVSAFVEVTEAEQVFQLLEANEDVDLVLLGEGLAPDEQSPQWMRLQAVVGSAVVMFVRDAGDQSALLPDAGAPVRRLATTRAAFADFLQEVLECGEPPSDAHISDRQRQILGLLALGLRNRQIAQELGIAETTVREHVSRLLRLLHVNNRSAAVAVARQEGLLTP